MSVNNNKSYETLIKNIWFIYLYSYMHTNIDIYNSHSYTDTCILILCYLVYDDDDICPKGLCLLERFLLTIWQLKRKPNKKKDKVIM